MSAAEALKDGSRCRHQMQARQQPVWRWRRPPRRARLAPRAESRGCCRIGSDEDRVACRLSRQLRKNRRCMMGGFGSGRRSEDHRPDGRARTRIINITATQPSAAPEKPGTPPSAPSASSAPTPKSNPANGFSARSLRTVAYDADGSGNGPTVRANPLETYGETAADGADANIPPQSAPERTGANGWRAKL
jgi:hypothetical protein